MYPSQGVARELLSRGAAADAAVIDGRTPLFMASWMGHSEVARELLSRGVAAGAADVAAGPAGASGLTPIMCFTSDLL